MPLPVSFYSMTIADNTLKANGQPETSSLEVPVTTITAGNYTATLALLATLQSTAEALLLGETVKHELIADRTKFADIPAGSNFAQRENKWLVRYHEEGTSKKFVVSLPTADLDQHMDNSEFVDLTAGNGLAFKNAFEAVVVSPADSGANVVVDSVQFVGRNS